MILGTSLTPVRSSWHLQLLYMAQASAPMAMAARARTMAFICIFDGRYDQKVEIRIKGQASMQKQPLMKDVAKFLDLATPK